MGLGTRRGRPTAGAARVDILGLGVALMVGHCSTAPPPPKPLAVEFAGCASVRGGPVCELSEDRALTVWMAAPDGEHVTFWAGGPLSVERPTRIQGGFRYRLVVPSSATELRIVTQDGRRRWRLQVGRPVRVTAIDEAHAASRAGNHAEAKAKLAGVLEDPRPEVQARAQSALGRIERRAGDAVSSIERLRRSSLRHQALGRLSDAVEDAQVVAYTLTHLHRRFAPARAALDAVSIPHGGYPRGAVTLAYYRATVAEQAGDLRTALRWLDTAERRAERVDDRVYLGASRVVRANILRQLGRKSDAIETLEQIAATVEKGADPCERADRLCGIGWAELLPGAPTREPAPRFEQALEIYRGPCRDPEKQANVLLNLALVDLSHHRTTAAAGRLEEARRALPKPAGWLKSWWTDIEARVALARGEVATARRAYGQLADEARRTHDPHGLWRSMVGQAEVSESAKQPEAALLAYAAAEAQLAHVLRLVPLGAGRDTFLGARPRGTKGHIDLLLRLGRLQSALEVARRSRTRLLHAVQRVYHVARLGPKVRAEWEHNVAVYRRERAALDEEMAEDWKRSADERIAAEAIRAQRVVRLKAALDTAYSVLPPLRDALPAPRAGELLLMFHPVREGWVGFAAGERGVVAHRLTSVPTGMGDAPQLVRFADALRVAFGAEIDRARTLRVLPYGPLRSVDFHALPWGGAPLVAALPVRYGLDLPGADTRTEPWQRALIVADPRLDLAYAREHERSAVERALAERGVDQVRTVVGNEATRQAVIAGLGPSGSSDGGQPTPRGLDLLHFTGHGEFGGRGGLDSALALAGGGRITVGDILALPRAPKTVVLTACEAARAALDAPAEGLGVAQAFVVAGAQAVVAPTRWVEAKMASEMSMALYRALEDPPPGDLAGALRRAQLELRQSRPGGDWAAFRVIEP